MMNCEFKPSLGFNIGFIGVVLSRKANTILSRLISRPYLLSFVKYKTVYQFISIRMPKKRFNIPNIIVYSYINTLCLKDYFRTKGDLIQSVLT